MRRLYGADVQGVEPSTFGARGARELRLPVLQRFVTSAAEVSEIPFDVVHCAGLVERVADPGALIKLMAALAAPDGLLVISAHDPSRVRELGSAERTVLASPSSHRALVSQAGLSKLLQNQDFRHLAFEPLGFDYVCFASRRPFELQRMPSEDVTRYLTELAEVAGWGPLRIGALYRLFRAFVDQGLYAEAKAIEPRLPIIDPAALRTVTDLDSYLRNYPSCAGPLLYYQGMLKANGYAEYEIAMDLFGRAYRFCRSKLKTAPQMAVVEADLIWRAKYCEALMAVNLRSLEVADRLLRELRAELTLKDLPAPLPPDLEPELRALEQRSRSVEVRGALSS